MCDDLTLAIYIVSMLNILKVRKTQWVHLNYMMLFSAIFMIVNSRSPAAYYELILSDGVLA